MARKKNLNLKYKEDEDWEDEFNNMVYDGTNVHVFVIDTGINRRCANAAGRRYTHVHAACAWVCTRVCAGACASSA